MVALSVTETSVASGWDYRAKEAMGQCGYWEKRRGHRGGWLAWGRDCSQAMGGELLPPDPRAGAPFPASRGGIWLTTPPLEAPLVRLRQRQPALLQHQGS